MVMARHMWLVIFLTAGTRASAVFASHEAAIITVDGKTKDLVINTTFPGQRVTINGVDIIALAARVSALESCSACGSLALAPPMHSPPTSPPPLAMMLARFDAFAGPGNAHAGDALSGAQAFRWSGSASRVAVEKVVLTRGSCSSVSATDGRDFGIEILASTPCSGPNACAAGTVLARSPRADRRANLRDDGKFEIELSSPATLSPGVEYYVRVLVPRAASPPPSHSLHIAFTHRHSVFWVASRAPHCHILLPSAFRRCGSSARAGALRGTRTTPSPARPTRKEGASSCPVAAV